jgi:serine/threonine protein kinase
MPNEPTTVRDGFDELADSFVGRLRAGERPSVEDYARRCPEMADELRELLPTLALLEQHATPDDATSGGQPAKSAAPREIGEFTIVREIGRGGMGVVYEAIQRSLGRRVALKVLSAAGLLNPTHLERFRLEARAAARLHHTHIVPVFGVGEHEGLHYYAMQYIEGQSLDLVIDALRQLRRPAEESATIADGGNEYTRAVVGGLVTGQFPAGAAAEVPVDASLRDVPPTLGETRLCRPVSPNLDPLSHDDFSSSCREFYRSVARVGLQAAEALAYAHSEGVLHRDVKPSNLMLDAKGHVWVTDFGLAKAEDSDGLTHTGDFVGTLRYMAPERLEGGCDRRSDVYSLGATLYELAALRTFLENGSRGQLVERILHEAPPQPSRFDRSLPRDLETIILKAIAKDPADRYRTADGMAEDLRLFLADRPVLARRSTAVERLLRWRRRNPLVAALAGAVAGLLMTAVVILAASNARIRLASATKDAALAAAYNAVDQMLTRVANDKFSDMPMSHPLRQALLEDALRIYEGFLAQAEGDVRLRGDMAHVLFTMAGLERELGRYADAARSAQRSIDLLRAAVATDPNPPEMLEQLAKAELDLAYTLEWSTDPPQSDNRAVESQYRKALRLFQQLEADWPDRRQAYVICLRYLAGLAYRRGDLAEAERTWRQSIARGEAYLDQRPDDIDTRTSVCWGCMEFVNNLLNASNDRAADAEAVLRKGLRHVSIGLGQKPSSIQIRDVSASLHFCLAQCYCHMGRDDEALPLFQQSVDEIESLCAAFPWNPDYWNTAHWFHAKSIDNLNDAGREQEAKMLARRMLQWVRTTAPKVPDQPEAQKFLKECQHDVISLLRSTGQEHEANEFERTILESRE